VIAPQRGDVTREEASPMPSLLSSATPTASPYWGRDTFERSLVYNLLFEPEGVAVPDAFFFCPLLLEHIKRGKIGKTWFEMALHHGLVRPYVRSNEIHDFQGLRSELEKNNLLGHFASELAHEVAGRLERARKLNLDWKAWPEGMNPSPWRFGFHLTRPSWLWVSISFLLHAIPKHSINIRVGCASGARHRRCKHATKC
jgi:hypothetical protein